jgi:hypothetical protein
MSEDDRDAERLLWGVPEIAEAIDRTPRQTWHLLNSGLLPAKKVGAKWVATKGGLRQFFAKAMPDQAAGAGKTRTSMESADGQR